MMKKLGILLTLICVCGAMHISCEKSKDEPTQHECVDLGLSVKWATMNVGATKVEEYGEYFAWGETNTKMDFSSWVTYKYCNGDWNSITKYTYPDGQKSACWYNIGGTFIGDNKTTLEAEDDAAHVNWGGNWRMPTHAEQKELISNCAVTWTSNYHGTKVAGYIFTCNKTGYTEKSIFFPAAGYLGNTYPFFAGTGGYYWSSSLVERYSDGAWNLQFSSGNVGADNANNRCVGCPIRAVCP